MPWGGGCWRQMRRSSGCRYYCIELQCLLVMITSCCIDYGYKMVRWGLLCWMQMFASTPAGTQAAIVYTNSMGLWLNMSIWDGFHAGHVFSLQAQVAHVL